MHIMENIFIVFYENKRVNNSLLERGEKRCLGQKDVTFNLTLGVFGTAKVAESVLHCYKVSYSAL